MEQYERIRRDHRDEGLSIRALAGRHGVHRRTVREALADAMPAARKTPVRTAPVLGPHEATVRRWLSEDMAAPRKQRHTGRRVWQRLARISALVIRRNPSAGTHASRDGLRAADLRIRAYRCARVLSGLVVFHLLNHSGDIRDRVVMIDWRDHGLRL